MYRGWMREREKQKQKQKQKQKHKTASQTKNRVMMMSGSDGEEEDPSHTKKRKVSASGVTLLPEEMVLSCLARVSRSEQASLSLVSKRYRSLLLTSELYKFRSLMGCCTENLIYLCLRIPQDPNPRWFTLSLDRPRRLVPVRSYFYQPHEASSMVAHGCGIYVMGGRIGGRASSSVMFLDCRSNTWTTLPSMGVARYSAAAGVVDGKIYIFGGCDDPNSSRWGEVFDPEKQTWDALPMPPHHCSLPSMWDCIVIKDEDKEKLVAINGSRIFVSYVPSESKWIKGIKGTSSAYRCWHVIDNVVFCNDLYGRILWCEPHDCHKRPGPTSLMKWREVVGLESLWDALSASKLVNYGGRSGDLWESRKPLMLAAGFEITELDDHLPGHKLSNSGNNNMLIFWDVLSPNKLEIWCAEVSLDRNKETCQIIGNILWSEAIMTLDPPPPNRLHCHILYTSPPLNL